MQGFINNLEEDVLVISSLNDFGELDGESYSKIEVVTDISCDNKEGNAGEFSL
ncbi:hypothetical protein [Peribacillus butanolivorans]